MAASRGVRSAEKNPRVAADDFVATLACSTFEHTLTSVGTLVGIYEFWGRPALRIRCAHVIFEPEDFIARLAALVPKPRAHQIRYHGVFAPASPDRARVVPRTRAAVAGECGEASVTDRQRALALTWAQRLKRVFAIEIETCRRCGGRLRVIASIEAPATIERILAHLGRAAEPVDPAYPSRAPPQGEFSFCPLCHAGP